MKGSRPPPCAAFSLTVTDEDQAVMFGGFTPSGESSEAHILHLPTMVSHLCRRVIIIINTEYLNFFVIYFASLSVSVLVVYLSSSIEEGNRFYACSLECHLVKSLCT